MVLSRLHLKNFKRYEEFSLSFREGLTGIIGRNGSGKSTIFEAIYFALYGEVKKQNVRYSGADAKAPVVVELWFETAEGEYGIERSFRGKNLTAQAKLFRAGTLVASGAAEVNAAVVKLTGMSKEAFSHTLFASQKELMSLGSLKNEERRKIIRKLLGLEKIDRIEKVLLEEIRERRRDIKSYTAVLMSRTQKSEKEETIRRLRIRIEKIETMRRETENEYRKLQEERRLSQKAIEVFKSQKERKRTLKSDYQMACQRVEALEKMLQKEEKEARALEDAAETLAGMSGTKAAYEALRSRLEEMQRARESQIRKEELEKRKREHRIRFEKLQEEIGSLEKELEPIRKQEERMDALEEKIRETEKRRLQLQERERRLQGKIAGAQRRIDDIRGQIETIEKLGRESPCPVCTRPLQEAYDEVLASLNRQITTLLRREIAQEEKKLRECSERSEEAQELEGRLRKRLQERGEALVRMRERAKELEKAHESMEELREKMSAIDEAIAALGEIEYDPKIHESVRKQEPSLKKEYDRVVRLETQLERRKRVEESLVQIKIDLKEMSEQKRRLEKAYREAVYDADAHGEEERHFETLERELDEKRSRIHDLSLEITRIAGEIEKIHETLLADAQKRRRLQQLERDLQDDEKIRILLDRFKTDLNARVAPRISLIASELFAMITRGRYQHIEVSDDFDFFIYDEGVRYPIGRFSGGEVDLANLVLRIAISRTLGELNGTSAVGFLAFDEIFGSQDHERRMMIMEALHLIKEQYRQIFLISHESEIKEMLENVVELG